jgi:uncharacterized protein (DUF1800 family)
MALRRNVLTVVVGCTAALWFTASTARAQFEPPPVDDATEKPDPKKSTKVEGFKKPTAKSKINSAQAGRLRLLELQAGARTKAGMMPTAANLSGPPLDQREQVIHALNRLGFGPRPGEVEQILEVGGTKAWEVWAGYQIDPASIDDNELESEVARRFPWTKMSLQDIKKSYPIAENYESNPQLRKELPEAVVFRASQSERVFAELMYEFWRNHFCINQPKDGAPTRSWTAPHYEEHVIRARAFGKFKDMLYASATHPAMLEYLDNAISKANRWNENYARELMELHTLGVDKYYTENDVIELSKVLTGWTYGPDLNFAFKESWHQPGNKTWLRATVPPGQKGGEMAIYELSRHKGTADFISEKLCRYLVNDNPPKELVSRVSAKFKSSDGDLPSVYWEIITSPEFISRANYRAKFKTPFEFTVSALRNTNAKISNGAEVCKALGKMGQPIYDCDDPTGYYDVAESWMDSGVLTTRWDFAWNLVNGSISGVSVPKEAFSRYEQLKPEETLAVMVDDLIGGDIGDRTRTVLKEAAMKNDQPRMLSIILGSPDFQQQ